MKTLYSIALFLLIFATPAFPSVSVSSPASGVVSSPVPFVATATANSCAKGVAAIGIYVSNKLTYVVNGVGLNTTIALAPGTYDTAVEEWDYCGGASVTPITITVGGAVAGVSVK